MVKIAMVDEHFAEEEKEVIRKIGEKYGASKEEMDEIFNSPPTIDSLAPMPVNDKMEFMMDCMLVVLADHVVTNSEDYFAKHIASTLGFKQEIISFLIDNKETDRGKMKELMLPYLVR